MAREAIRPSARRWVWITVPVVIALAFAVGWSWTSDHPTDEFCPAWGVLTDSPTVSYGEISLLVGEPISNREPCNGDDLWHYSLDDLAGVDGVLFENCEISWVGGGRSTAAAEGIDC